MSTRLAPALFVMLWSTGYIASKLGAPYAEPFTFLTWRFAIVLAILVPACLLLRAPWPKGIMAVHAVIAGALMHGLYLGGTFWAIRNGMPAGMAALIVSLQPVTTSVFAAVVLGEKIKPLHLVGLGLGLAGAFLVVSPKLSGPLASGGYHVTPAALLASVISLIAITFGTIYQKRTHASGDLRTATVLQFAGALVVTGLLAALTETRTVVWSGEFIFALLWLVVVLSIGAVGLLMLMIRASAVSRVAALFYLVPAVTAVMAWGLFGETMSLIQMLGILLVSLAVLLISSVR